MSEIDMIVKHPVMETQAKLSVSQWSVAEILCRRHQAARLILTHCTAQIVFAGDAVLGLKCYMKLRMPLPR